jgi:hypothetical protein
MRCRAGRLTLLITTLVCFAGGVAAAQERATDTMEILREKARADKKLVVAAALDLSESEAKGFWPVYNAYQSDMIVHYDRVVKLIEDFAKTYETMSDQTATQLLGDFLAIETDLVALRSRYLSRFQRVLPARKVARFYQLENKIRAILDYHLAREIPLVK